METYAPALSSIQLCNGTFPLAVVQMHTYFDSFLATDLLQVFSMFIQTYPYPCCFIDRSVTVVYVIAINIV